MANTFANIKKNDDSPLTLTHWILKRPRRVTLPIQIMYICNAYGYLEIPLMFAMLWIIW